MPKVVEFFVLNGSPFSAKTGQAVNIRSGRAEYREVGLPEYFSTQEGNVGGVPGYRKLLSKMARDDPDKKQAALERKTIYRTARDAALPPQYIAPTVSGKQRKIGLAKDSYINNVNKSFATVYGLKQNQAGRTALQNIYIQEMQAALAASGNILSRAANQFNHKKHWRTPYQVPANQGNRGRAFMERIAANSQRAVNKRNQLYAGYNNPPGTPLDFFLGPGEEFEEPMTPSQGSRRSRSSSSGSSVSADLGVNQQGAPFPQGGVGSLRYHRRRY